jgi:hypothetical protein
MSGKSGGSFIMNQDLYNKSNGFNEMAAISLTNPHILVTYKHNLHYKATDKISMG